MSLADPHPQPSTPPLETAPAHAEGRASIPLSPAPNLGSPIARFEPIRAQEYDSDESDSDDTLAGPSTALGRRGHQSRPSVGGLLEGGVGVGSPIARSSIVPKDQRVAQYDAPAHGPIDLDASFLSNAKSFYRANEGELALVAPLAPALACGDIARG